MLWLLEKMLLKQRVISICYFDTINLLSLLGVGSGIYERLKSAIEAANIDMPDFLEDSMENVHALCSTILDAVMTKEKREAIESIISCFKKLKNFDSKIPKIKQGFLPLILALVKKGHEKLREDENEIDEQENSVSLTSEDINNLKRFGNYAVQMYPLTLVDLTQAWNWTQEAVATKLSVSVDDILMYYITDDVEVGMCPKFVLFLDHEAKSTVLAIRGTWSPQDAVRDIEADEAEFLDGHAHKGILESANKVLSKVLNDSNSRNVLDIITESIEKYPSYSLTITGHSLGAGTAELITMLLLDRNLIPDTTKVQCIALAPPPIFRSQNPLPPKISSAIKIYVNRHDCVPRLSLASVARIMAEVSAVDQLGIKLKQQLKILKGDDDENMQKIIEVLKYVDQDSLPYLEHPSETLHHIRFDEGNESDKKHKIFLSHSTKFSKSILLLDSMVADHMDYTYGKVLQNLAQHSSIEEGVEGDI